MIIIDHYLSLFSYGGTAGCCSIKKEIWDIFKAYSAFKGGQLRSATCFRDLRYIESFI